MKKHSRVNTRKRRKKLFVERFGGKCQICGYNKCQNSLVFHHINPDEKEYTPTELMNLSIEKAEKELSKCILVCSNCHGEIHSEEYDFEYTDEYLNSLNTEWVETTCEFCFKVFSFKKTNSNNKQKFCSQKCSQLSQRKVKYRPTRNELKKLISEYKWTELGRMFNVSDNTVRKWAKNYEII